jgi:hypothetical protein
MRVMAAVLFLLAVEAGMLAYFAGDFRPARLGLPESAPTARRVGVPGQSTEPDRPIDLSMAGWPFRMSDSVVEDCRRFPNSGCEARDEFLGVMAGEWRDPEWAARTEASLARVITRGGRRDYKIRALECRSSRCAIEVASDTDYPRISLITDDALDRELTWYGPSASAWEEHANVLTIVTVATWVRRPRSELEDPPLPVTENQYRQQQRESAQSKQQ